MRDGSVALVTDSTATIHSLDARGAWHIVPLGLEIDDRRLREGPELSAADFHRMLRQVNTVPATVPPSSEDFATVYRALLERHDRLLSIHISGDLSDTVANARSAVRAMGVEDRATVVDSRLAGLGLGLLCLEAERRLADGESLPGAQADLEEIVAETSTWFSVFTLDFLYLGGRLERSSPPPAGHGDDRPILSIENGRLSLVERVLGETTRVQRIADLLADEYGGDEPLVAACVHAGPRGEEAAHRLERILNGTRGGTTAWFRAPLGPVLCAHTGFDVCGISVYPRRLSAL